MGDFSELSDFEINKRVAKAVGKYEYVSDVPDGASSQVLCDTLSRCEPMDYCNDPADAWPIIVENKISIWSQGIDSDLWCAHFHNEERLKFVSANPLRAAMIVYLMMKEGEHE